MLAASTGCWLRVVLSRYDVGAGLDDVGVEGEPVDDGGGEAGVGEGGAPFGERGVGRAGDGGFLLAAVMIWNSSSAPRASSLT